MIWEVIKGVITQVCFNRDIALTISMWYMKSDNNTVKTISMIGVNGLYSVLGANYRVLCTKYGYEFK